MSFVRVPSRAGWLHRQAALGTILGWGLWGCTEPKFVDLPCDAGSCADAGADHDPTPAPDAGDDAGRDAGHTSQQTDTTWGAGMVGKYAMRIRFYSKGSIDGSHYDHEILMLADITQDPSGRVSMDAQRCQDLGHAYSKIVPGGVQTFEWPHAANLPKERFELAFSNETFYTLPGSPRALGYEADKPAGCATGDTQPAGQGRPWLADGTCACRAESLPTTIDDCRVTDADQDGEPGLTVKQSGLYNGENYVRIQDSCQIVAGSIAKNGQHRAQYVEDYDFRELECSGGSCASGTVIGCLSKFNPVEFEPLSGSQSGWDCSTLLTQVKAGTVFSGDKLAFPDGCDPH
ncbi:MAG: hypothetical protein QM778_38445 [Myxococcales bacterium]